MRLRELILQSWTALHRNRMRSALTMLGISWGVVSVVLLLAFGQGLGNGVVSAVGNIGNNVIVIWPGQTSMQAGGQRAGRPVHFEYEDVEAIRAEVPIIRAVSAESCSDFGYKTGTRVVSLTTRGVEPPYGEMRRLMDFEDGHYFEDSDFTNRRRVVILGNAAAKRLFQGAPAVGQSVLVQGQSFEVIGVLNIKIQDSMYQGPDNEQAFIPFQVYNELKNERDPNMIIIQPITQELHTEALAARAPRHRAPPSFRSTRREGYARVGHCRHRQNVACVLHRASGNDGNNRRAYARSRWRRRDEHHAGQRQRAHA